MQWLAVTGGADGGDPIVGFVHLLSHSMAHRQCRSLFRQLVWQLGRRLAACARECNQNGTHGDLSVTLQVISSILDQPHELEKHLLRYVLLMYVHDKGNCSGLQLEAASFHTDHNLAVACCPKARFCYVQFLLLLLCSFVVWWRFCF